MMPLVKPKKEVKYKSTVVNSKKQGSSAEDFSEKSSTAVSSVAVKSERRTSIT